jgi:hypothetical protein
MSTGKYQIAIATAGFVATALLLAVQPLSLSAGRAADVGPVKAAAVRGDIAEGLAEPEPADDVAAYRQAIEDVLPLMRSLQARGDTARLAQLARSVIEVWNELDTINPQAVPDHSLREVIEDWAGRDRATSRRQEPAERSER